MKLEAVGGRSRSVAIECLAVASAGSEVCDVGVYTIQINGEYDRRRVRERGRRVLTLISHRLGMKALRETRRGFDKANSERIG
jgi:hypothetical protein